MKAFSVQIIFVALLAFAFVLLAIPACQPGQIPSTLVPTIGETEAVTCDALIVFLPPADDALALATCDVIFDWLDAELSIPDAGPPLAKRGALRPEWIVRDTKGRASGVFRSQSLAAAHAVRVGGKAATR